MFLFSVSLIWSHTMVLTKFKSQTSHKWEVVLHNMDIITLSRLFKNVSSAYQTVWRIITPTRVMENGTPLHQALFKLSDN